MRLTLTATEFEVAWDALGLGDLPLLFRVRISRIGATAQERAMLVAATMAGLRARGLADARGPSAGLADALTLLARRYWSIDARLDFHRECRALGAATQRHAVVAVLDVDTMTMTPSTPHGLAGDMIDLTGDVAGGGGRSINLPAEALVAAAERVAANGANGMRARELILADELINAGVPPYDARALANLNVAMIGAGQFGVEVVDQDGTIRRAPRFVGFCDTLDGRWAQLRTAGHGGQEWITFTPAGRAQLTAMLIDLLAECGVRPF